MYSERMSTLDLSKVRLGPSTLPRKYTNTSETPTYDATTTASNNNNSNTVTNSNSNGSTSMHPMASNPKYEVYIKMIKMRVPEGECIV